MINNPYRSGTTPYAGYPGYVQVPMGTPQQGQYPPSGIPSGSYIPGSQGGPTAGQQQPAPGLLPLEQSYIENILRLNLGKMATIYMTYENNSEWNAKIFKGRLEAAGRDHIIISDSKTGMRYLLLMVNLDYITFDEELKYTYPYTTPQQR
jgi:spore germination protein Q